MFCKKKFLSLIGLLIFGCKSIKAQDATVTLPDCTGASMENERLDGVIATYCIKSNIIYGVTATTAVNYVKKLTDAPGIHAFIKTSDSAISEVDLYDESASIANVANLALYNCNGSQCEAAYGYVKIGAAYYSVTTGVGPASAVTDDDKLGVLKANKKVKSTANGDIPFSSDDSLRYYMLDGTVDGSNPFTKTTTGNVIIEAGRFAIVKNTITKALLTCTTAQAGYTDGTSLTAETYCIHDNAIYAIQATSKEKLAAGIYALAIVNGVATAVNLGGQDSSTEAYIALYQCSGDPVTCTKTYGYIYTGGGDGTTPTYINVDASGTTAAAETTTCSDASDIGKLNTSDHKVSIYDESALFTKAITAEGTKYYLMANKAGNIFTGALEDSNSIILTAAPNAIYKNMVGEGVNLYKLASGELTAVDPSQTAINTANKYRILDCNRDSECQSVPGYLMEKIGEADAKYFKVLADGTTTSETPIVGEDIGSTVAEICEENVGKLYTLAGEAYLCLTPELSVEMSTEAGSKTYLMSNVKDNIFTGAAEEDHTIMIKASPYLFSFYPIEAGVHTVKVTTTTNEVSSPLSLSAAIDVSDAETSPVFLYDCSSESVCTVTSGVIYDTSKYYTVSLTGGVAPATPQTGSAAISECSDFKGKLFALEGVIYVCLNAEKGAPMSTTTSASAASLTYLMTNSANNVITGVAADANAVILKTSYHTFSLVQVADGVHALEVDANMKCIEDTLGSEGEVTTAANLQLYNCVSGDCKRTYGYVIIGSTNFYTVTAQADTAATGSVKAEYTGTCDGAHKGTVYTGLLLCLDYVNTTPIPSKALGDEGEDNYLLENIAENVFTYTSDATENEKFIVIKSVPNAFVLNNVFEGGTYYVNNGKRSVFADMNDIVPSAIDNFSYFCNASGVCTKGTSALFTASTIIANNQIYTVVANAQAPATFTAANTSGIMAFTKGTFPKLESNTSSITDITKIILYTCRGGVCEVTIGFLKYGTNSLGECTTDGCVANTSNVSETPLCSRTNVGKAFINTGSENKLQFCSVSFAKNMASYTLVTVSSAANHINYDGTNYSIYQSNTNIIGADYGGYYLIKGNALVEDDGTSIDDGLLINCSVNDNTLSCTEIEKTSAINGFYINAGSTAYPFIECSTTDGKTSCIGVASGGDPDAACDDATGKLCKDDSDNDIVKVLISTGKVAEFITDPKEDDVYYIMSNADGNIFSGVGENSIIIRATTNAIIIHQIENGVHAFEVDDTYNTIIEDELGSQGTVTTEDNLHLYICEEFVCTETYGYVIIGTNYYTISKQPTAPTITSASLSDLAGSCSAEGDRGTLYKASDALLCLDHTGSKSTQKIDATGDPINYIMPNVANNVFTYSGENTDKFIVILAAPNAIVYNSKIKDSTGGLYVTDKNVLVNLEDGCDESKELVNNHYTCDENGLCTGTTSEVNSPSSVVYLAILANSKILCSAVLIDSKIIFSPLDTTDIIVAPTSTTASADAILYEVTSDLPEDLTEGDYDIYECVNGSCISVDGYFMFVKGGIEDIADCVATSGTCADGTSINCDNNSHFGQPNIDASTKALTLCVNVGGTKTKAPMGQNGLKYFSDATTYSRYKSDSTGRVIVKSTPEAGYYIIDSSEEHLGDLVSTADAEGILVLCDDENSCDEVTDVGYYRNKGDVDGTVPFIQCTSDEKCKAIAVPSLVACNANNIGLLDKNGKICASGEGLEIPINEDATTINYLVTGASASNIFTEEATVNSFILTTTSGSIKFKSDVTEGVNAFEFNDTDYSLTSVTLGIGNTDPVVMAKLRLYMCESNICFRTYGYVLIGSNYYTVSRKGTINSKGLTEFGNTCNSTSKIGSLHRNGNIFICLNYTNAPVLSQQIGAVGAKNYIMPNVAGNVFTNSETTEEDSYIIVRAGDNAIVLNVLYERKGNYLGKTDHEIITDTGTSTSLFITCETDAPNEYTCTKLTTITDGYYIHGIVGMKLISCSDNSCQLVLASAGYYGGALNNLIQCGASCGDPTAPAIGYYKNKDEADTEHPYIECSTETHCELIETPDAATETCAIGHLITYDEKAKLCLDGVSDHSQGFTDSGEKDFLLSYHASSLFVNKIPDGFAGVIKITTTEIIIDEAVDDNRCVSTTTLQVTDKAGETDCSAGTEAYEHCSNGICSSTGTAPSCVPKTGDFCTENTDYICTDEEGTKLNNTGIGFLYQCINANEPCLPYTNIGFLISNGKLYSCYNSANSGPPSIKCRESVLPTTSCSSTSIGTIVKDASDPEKFALCLDYNGTTPVAITLANTAHVMLKYTSANGDTFGLSNTQYALVKVDETTVTLNNEYEDDYGYMYIYAKKSDYSILEKGTTCPTKVEGVYPLLEFDCEKGICQETSS